MRTQQAQIRRQSLLRASHRRVGTMMQSNERAVHDRWRREQGVSTGIPRPSHFRFSMAGARTPSCMPRHQHHDVQRAVLCVLTLRTHYREACVAWQPTHAYTAYPGNRIRGDAGGRGCMDQRNECKSGDSLQPQRARVGWRRRWAAGEPWGPRM